MRLFFIAPRRMASVYHRLAQNLKEMTPIETTSYYVANRAIYEECIAQTGPIAFNGEVLCEWEIADRGIKRRPEASEIAKWEERLGIPSLWPAIVCDRRIYLGRLCKVRQDYKPHLPLGEMQGIIVELVETIWDAFERLKPDVVVGHIPAITGDLIIYWVARAQGIPYLHLKPIKIGNYVTYSTDPYEGHPHIREKYERYSQGTDQAVSYIQAARDYLDQATKGRVVYEGIAPQSLSIFHWRPLLRFIRYAPQSLLTDLRHTGYDPQYVPYIPFQWQQVIRPLRIQAARWAMKPATIDLEELVHHPYVFYPLNSEPEVALSVYARFSLNQIEVARNIAQSLSLGTLLVVKEHPRSLGLRTTGYYRKLREIPNVRFVPVETPTDRVIEHARAVTIISGFAGFEAILQRVPVVILGHCPYSMLPETMVRTVKNMEELPNALHDLIQNYTWDEQGVISFLAACMCASVPVDLYTTIFGMANRSPGTGAKGSRRSADDQYRDLAAYLLRRMREEGVTE